MEEKEMEEMEMEMEEREMEKEREEDVKQREEEGEQREEGGSCLSGFRSHPYPISKGLLVLAACQPVMIQHNLSVFVVVSKPHEMNTLLFKCGKDRCVNPYVTWMWK